MMVNQARGFIKRPMLIGLLVFCYLMVVQCSWVYPASPKNSPEDAQWLNEWRSNVEQDQLYLYAVKLLKEPVDSKAKVTATFEDQKFGTIRFTFAGGAEFILETDPPETSLVTLRIPNGFPDKQEALAVLQQYVKEIGVTMDWSKPEQHKEGIQLIQSYEAVDPDLNAFAVCVYEKEKLVEMRFSLAV